MGKGREKRRNWQGGAGEAPLPSECHDHRDRHVADGQLVEGNADVANGQDDGRFRAGPDIDSYAGVEIEFPLRSPRDGLITDAERVDGNASSSRTAEEDGAD